MRYLIITYYKKANGQIDEVMAVAKNLKNRDISTGSVILDFKKLEVIKASLNGTQVPRDFDRIAEYYYQHYKSTMDRLFAENGYAVDFVVKEDDTTKTNTD